MDDFKAPKLDWLNKCREMELECNRIWIKAIEFSPQLARYCKRFNDFSTGQWAVLLSHCPEFINIAPLHKLSAGEWTHILYWQPQLEAECPIMERLSDEQKAFIKSNTDCK